jgi:hypothetical protein
VEDFDDYLDFSEKDRAALQASLHHQRAKPQAGMSRRLRLLRLRRPPHSG